MREDRRENKRLCNECESPKSTRDAGPHAQRSTLRLKPYLTYLLHPTGLALMLSFLYLVVIVILIVNCH